MCWMCDAPTLTRADALERMAGLVERYGWALQFVEDDAVHPPWAYTVGLTLRGLPELVVTGLPAEYASVLLNDRAHQLVYHDEPITPGVRVTLDEGLDLEVVELPHPDAHLLTAEALFRGVPLRALQLVWHDDGGRWPWEVAFNDGLGGQPVLGPRLRAVG